MSAPRSTATRSANASPPVLDQGVSDYAHGIRSSLGQIPTREANDWKRLFEDGVREAIRIDDLPGMASMAHLVANLLDAGGRMSEAIEEWASRAPSDVVVFSHGSSSRIGMMGLLGLSLSHRTLGNLGNTCWSRLRRRPDGQWTLERHNVWVDVLYPGVGQ